MVSFAVTPLLPFGSPAFLLVGIIIRPGESFECPMPITSAPALIDISLHLPLLNAAGRPVPPESGPGQVQQVPPDMVAVVVKGRADPWKAASGKQQPELARSATGPFNTAPSQLLRRSHCRSRSTFRHPWSNLVFLTDSLLPRNFFPTCAGMCSCPQSPFFSKLPAAAAAALEAPLLRLPRSGMVASGSS